MDGYRIDDVIQKKIKERKQKTDEKQETKGEKWWTLN